MSITLSFRLVSPEKAEELRVATADREEQIVPRPVEAGPHAGLYAFSEGVMLNPAFADLHESILAEAPTAVSFDIDEAWPPIPLEE